jgi:PAS domain S-box-containing protein
LQQNNPIDIAIERSASIGAAYATVGNRRLAYIVAAVSVAIFAACIPFAAMPLTKIPAVIPAYQAAMAIVDLLTAALLLGQFNRLRTPRLLLVAAGYFFSVLLAIAYTLSFPGALSPEGLFGDSLQTSVWLYTFWHGGFPIFIIAYALASREHKVPTAAIRPTIWFAVAATIVLCAGLTWLAAHGEQYLPNVMQGEDFSRQRQIGAGPVMILLSVLALVALWRRGIVTVIELWLAVVMVVWVCDLAISGVFSTRRYDLGWYLGRSYGLAAASFLLCVLLIQANDLQNRLLAAAIRRSESYRQDSARLMEILDQAPLLVAIRDLDGRMLMANSLNLRWVSESQASWRGKTTREIFGDVEFSDQHETLDETVKTTGKPVQGRLLMPTKNGIRPLFCVKFPLFDDYDQIEAVGSVAIDITEQEKLSAAMERIFISSVDLILVTNSNGDIIRVSPSLTPILGYMPEEWVGQNAIKFIHPDDLDSTREEMRIARRGHRTRNFETRYLHKDGRAVTLSWTGVWSEETREHFYIGRDMTERQKLEMELRQSQKMDAIGQLTGGIAHDYNNLLTVILGNTEILAEMLKDKPEMHSLAQLALDAADRSATLTQRLLAFGRRQALEAEPTDVNGLLGDMTDLLIATIGEQVRIVLRRSDNLWTPVLDRGQFETAIVNLAVNARDAMPDGGTITIETRNVTLDDDYIALNPSAVPGDYIAVHITDTGAGMSQETLARVFEPFFTTKEVGKGTGLGLSMIYGFVKQSGGHITIYSEPGRGTVVRLYFPRSGGFSAVPAERAAPGTEEVPTGSESILLVEDDPMVRTHTEKQLIALGYRVTTAEKGPTALKLIEQGLKPDLLFTDIIRPDGMNGRQLADAVRKHMPDLRVLFTSGYTQGADVGGNGHEKGTGFLGKPFRRIELARKLREMLDA